VQVAVCALAALSLCPPGEAAGAEPDPSGRFDKSMRTRDTVLVYTNPRRSAHRVSRIAPGAVIRVDGTGLRKGCREGWMEREGGGFVCARYLAPAGEDAPGPAAEDLPGVLEGVAGWSVVRGGSRLFKRLKDVDAGHVYKWLYGGSTLMVRETVTRYGEEYHRTRAGWWATAGNTSRLPEPVRTLRLEVGEGEAAPGSVRLRAGASASVRPAPEPPQLGPDEKWIAVDLEQQLLHAYVGERLVMVVPCSTGLKGNTRPGRYRIQWKRRLQTMQLRGGHVRVEDVQWVMYYDRRNSIAIHAAYWHSDFGRPMSHGCVNLPTEDARWLYEWSLPRSMPEDSESFQSEENPGTRVVVFR